ncbi:hypothetical protein [Methylobacterium sp. WL120]|uniref:hypothetical protein n=1 Tax=Methylobacterium sp. WL120 TaxID=2603887 RepID=UPI0011CB01F9|nr:hypothetical protein [Methylobacterium sp. WL120]TXM63732.1 hypothetical protein FV229_21380 [Methylobacterium sp. WL120]
MRAAERGADADESVRRRVARLLHVPPLALLFALGLAPLFLLFPLLPGGAEADAARRPVALWLGAALLAGFAGTVAGAARPLYRAAAHILVASLLSIPAMRLALGSGVPVPHGLAAWLGLDGESAMDADLYEIWLLAWLAAFGLVAAVRHGLARFRRTRAAAPPVLDR